MPVQFLSPLYYQRYGQYNGIPNEMQLTQYFYLDEHDQAFIRQRRRPINRLGCALQLVTVRFLGTFIADLSTLPEAVVDYVAQQLLIPASAVDLTVYQAHHNFFLHRTLICQHYGYQNFHDPIPSLGFLRWLYTRTWISSERPTVLFDLAVAWLVEHKILLPGVTVLERLVAQVRERSEKRSWQLLNRHLTAAQRQQLRQLIEADDGAVLTWDRLRQMPTHLSSLQLRAALQRLEQLRGLGLHQRDLTGLSDNRLRSMADYALTATVRTLRRLDSERQTALLLAGIQVLAIQIQDLILDMFDQWLHESIAKAKHQIEQERLGTLAQYDEAALYLRNVGHFVMTSASEPQGLTRLFEKFPPAKIQAAIATIDSYQRPEKRTYQGLLMRRYRAARLFFPALLRLIQFQGVPEAVPVLKAVQFLQQLETDEAPALAAAPGEVIASAWHSLVYDQRGFIRREAYTLCVLQALHQRLRKRDIYVMPSQRWHDPRQYLLSDADWQRLRPHLCRTLDRQPDPIAELNQLTRQLDEAYQQTAAALTSLKDLRMEATVDGQSQLVLSPLDALPETPLLHTLRQQLVGRLPPIDLSHLLLEVHHMTGFAHAFTHVSQAQARTRDFPISVCAVLLAQGCNIGLESLADEHHPALTLNRLRWVQQNYVRPETLSDASDLLVNAQSQIRLAQYWGGGEVASADGLRFVVPQRALHGGFNRHYFGTGRGITFYNFLSDQFTGFHHVVIPGTLREALYVLEGLLDHTSQLRPKEVMTDTNSYTDVVFGLFWLLGFQFSPRLAHLTDRRFWRISRQTDYGIFNPIARSTISPKRILNHWDDLLRVAGSLHMGTISASSLMRIFASSPTPSSLTYALQHLGRVAKTIYMLSYMRDETYRRRILTQLNYTEQRHHLARRLMYGNRGELKHTYREGQEEQLAALGLLLNIVVYWNTVYLDLAWADWITQGGPSDIDELHRITPLVYDHIRILGRYTFPEPPSDASHRLRPLKPSPAPL